ncbi:MAG: GTPase ObgE [Bdellovibrionales bacterium]|nr:GTPase ObgE [Bdellovibrionales bacterium]
MKFIDEAIIKVQAGKGGAGARHFRREKFVPRGGPDGGNGGRGGSVVLVADRNKHTLIDFRFQPIWKADDGEAGHGSLKDGKSGADLNILVPIGTQVIDPGTSETIADLLHDGEIFEIARGGRGGKGNAFFKSASDRAPEHAQPGEAGQEGEYKLSLKVVADLGLVGFPNAGKSTLISRISAARPKIADYPFTTLEPNLGVVQARSGRSFVVADIPGLIPGAHTGKGLGIKFLKHIERTKLIAHLIDIHQLDSEGNSIDPLESYQSISQELENFSASLAEKQEIVVLTKIDAMADRSEITALKEKFAALGKTCLAISSVSGEGIPEFVEHVAAQLSCEAISDERDT